MSNAILEFDRINKLNKNISIPYEQYFGEMELTDIEKEQRISLAKDLEDDMLFFFALLAVMKEQQYEDTQYAQLALEKRYKAHLKQYMELDEYSNERIKKFVSDTIETTKKHSNDEWYTSNDRAMLIAENESNSSFNYKEYKEAAKSGKAKKRWITTMDNRARHTHRVLNGKTIPINSIFLVGNSEMYFPKDETFSPEACEIANCRCSIKYL